jgi:hypothetical protein
MLLEPSDPLALADQFLELASWPMESGRHLDLQYTPLLECPGHVVMLPRTLAHSAPTRNLLASRSIRVDGVGDEFTAMVHDILSTRFSHVATERVVELDGVKTDVDVAVLSNSHLFIFECKHNLPSASTHEEVDHWSDIVRGVHQLQRASTILAADSRLRQRLASWFPSATKAELTVNSVHMAVITSTRTFCGVETEGIAIRDFYSLAKVLGDGLVDVYERVGAAVQKHRWRFWKNDEFGIEDLLDFLTPRSRLVSMRFSGLFWACELQWQSTDLCLARETCGVVRSRDYRELIRDLRDLGLRPADAPS